MGPPLKLNSRYKLRDLTRKSKTVAESRAIKTDSGRPNEFLTRRAVAGCQSWLRRVVVRGSQVLLSLDANQSLVKVQPMYVGCCCRQLLQGGRLDQDEMRRTRLVKHKIHKPEYSSPGLPDSLIFGPRTLARLHNTTADHWSSHELTFNVRFYGVVCSQYLYTIHASIQRLEALAVLHMRNGSLLVTMQRRRDFSTHLWHLSSPSPEAQSVFGVGNYNESFERCSRNRNLGPVALHFALVSMANRRLVTASRTPTRQHRAA